MKVACIMMQKNEDELFGPWVEYHSKLFGYENIYIFDNGSSSENLKSLFEKYKNLGVNIFFDKNLPKDFENKGGVIGELISKLETGCQYDFYIPLDCDEFLAVLNEKGHIIASRSDIFSELQCHIGTEDVLLARYQYFNSPLKKGDFFKRKDRKCFFYKNTFKSMDVGFHWGKSLKSNGEHRTNIIQLHFHNKPFEMLKKHANEKLKSRVINFDRETLIKYKGAGSHLVKYLLIDELEYLNEFIAIDMSVLDKIVDFFNSNGILWPYEEYNSKAIKKINLKHDKVNALATRFGYKYEVVSGLKGFVDNFHLEGSNLSFKGWAFFNEDELVKSFKLLVNGAFILNGEGVQRIARPDVSKVNNHAPLMCGFHVYCKLPKEISPEALENVALMCSKDEFNLGANLRFGDSATIALQKVLLKTAN